ncbi:MAG TPA: O-acetyl-ADP-ribose deacetylase [Candidatus Moranbacteria bacterium]|nr:O-acetyl-ADP-ribose deacetylase [Candidatus Moranbacteria bacterium]
MMYLVPMLKDITTLEVDAIVNAANESLLGGGGVDGAIHRAAGPRLLAECRTLGGARTGEAKITKGYNLPTKFVIHTPGPIYGRNNGQDAELLASCYRESLKRAQENGVKTIAFPCISTGAFGYPKEDAARIAIATVREFLTENPDCGLEDIIFSTASRGDYELYVGLLK